MSADEQGWYPRVVERGFLCSTPIGESARTEAAFDFWYWMLDDAEFAPLFPIEASSTSLRLPWPASVPTLASAV
jgi:hypothetical protein